MIEVLVVDDDKLARQGLISAMPWSEFDMRVVGEAQNGEKALEFLAHTRVDLMLTDLAMPVMSGIELMREARARYPGLHCVVLTLHQDFEFVQEALRLGALDYIAKVQLEQERFEEVLGRIHARFMQEKARGVASDARPERFEADQVRVLFSQEEQPDAGWLTEPSQTAAGACEEIEAGIWLVEQNGADIAEESAKRSGWSVMALNGLTAKPRKDVRRLLRAYRQHPYFYDCPPPGEPYRRTFAEISELCAAGPDDRGFEEARTKWLAFEWLYDEGEFESALSELGNGGFHPSRIQSLLMLLEAEWNRVYAPFVGKLQSPDRPGLWREAEAWIRELRTRTADAMIKPQYSREVAASIMRAVRIIQDEVAEPVLAAETARRVNMSRSYFSQVFKEITGFTFNEFQRKVRIDRAKEYLLHTTRPIQWIAEHTGYMDEKYFSRIFRDSVGMLPSEFRQRKQDELRSR